MSCLLIHTFNAVLFCASTPPTVQHFICYHVLHKCSIGRKILRVYRTVFWLQWWSFTVSITNMMSS